MARIAASQYITADVQVGIRQWTRQDRSAIERWPRSAIPAHWASAGPVTGMRASYAVDVLPPASPQLIGRITLRNPREHRADLGIYLHPEWCGQGYGSAALLVMQRYLWGVGMQALTLEVAVENNRALRAYQRAGWQTEGRVERDGHVYLRLEVRA